MSFTWNSFLGNTRDRFYKIMKIEDIAALLNWDNIIIFFCFTTSLVLVRLQFDVSLTLDFNAYSYYHFVENVSKGTLDTVKCWWKKIIL